MTLDHLVSIPNHAARGRDTTTVLTCLRVQESDDVLLAAATKGRVHIVARAPTRGAGLPAAGAAATAALPPL